MGDFTCCYLACGQDLPEALLTLATVPPWLWLTATRDQAVAAIRRYQTEISAKRGPVCRYTPSCSHYGVAALQRFGLVRGSWLTVRRLARCRASVPWGTPDPVPQP
ncbi:hypothetical protein GCM10009682_02160 [Luedemannella flava]|uniref:Membrane protein insertion efficiency factor n=1 Tax=Luedemannella flava TaxID=349316 RepID=A0ABN2LCB6_9ACTN